ncbi:imidazole glycerol phosphate synthase subunit HisF [Candidatus Micrarchaeota archaeon]|nr:imidazole glycerol phosphate synthase subunit HisF [Candidatus Micrarchaeota archaeon]
MLSKRIIACLDVKDGQCVKGTNFVNLQYAGKPAELAGNYAKQGADEIVFLDISASGEGRKTSREWIKECAKALDVPFTVGGGIKNNEDVREVLACGADKVAINTSALENPGIISAASRAFGCQCIVVAVDAKKVAGEWMVFSYGGSKPTGKNALDWVVECEGLGAGEILLTSIDADGTKNGFDLELTKAVADKVGIPVIASGGAGCERDFLEVFEKTGCDAALAAGIFHYGKTSVVKVKEFLAKNNVKVRVV